MLVWYDGKSMRRVTKAEADALYPRRGVDPELDERLRAAAGRLLGRIWNPKRIGLVEADLEEAELAEIWPTAIDWEGVERVGGVRIRRATHSLHRPRHVARRRPALLAFLLRVVGARG